MAIVIVTAMVVGAAIGMYAIHRQASSTTTGRPTVTIQASTSPSSSTTCESTSEITTTSTNQSAIFNSQTIPSNFTIGGYRFVVLYDGSPFSYTVNGTVYVNAGWGLAFNITRGSETQTVKFGSAPPAPYPPSVPSPSTATAFNGSVQLQWLATCNAIFLEIEA